MAKQYGKWIIVDSVDEGGQGFVYRVRHSEKPPTEIYALKRLKNTNRIERFQAEIIAASALDHVAIIRPIEHDLTNANPYVVLPYFAKGNLSKAGVLDWPLARRMRLFTHILDGMSHAHAKSVVHRDLKPANILLSDADSPVIADWGIAHIEGGARLTLTDEAVGARNYIPPEAEVGRVDDVAASFDVYSLGKILYWLLSGRELVREYVREPNYNLCQVLGESRYEAVNQLLDKCVTEQPSSRFKDAGELREAFDELSKTLEKYVNFPSTDSTQRCIYCGIGKYEAIAPYRNGEGQSERRPLDALIGVQGGVYHGTEPGGLRAMICDRCGNVQLFRVEFRSGNEKSTLPGRPWRSKAK